MTAITSSRSVEADTSALLLHQEIASTWQWRIETDPELAAAMGLLSHRRSKHALDPRSPESFNHRLDWMKAALGRVEAVQRDQLNDANRLSLDLYVKQLTDYVTFTPKYKAYLCCINRLEGPQTDLPLYASYLPLKTKENREFYLQFLKAIPTQLSEVMELLQCGLRENRTPPSVSLGGVVDQIRGFVNSGLQSLQSPLNKFPDSDQDLKQKCAHEIDGAVKEAFHELADFLEVEYVPKLRREISATFGYPDGDEYYRDCLAFHTTTTMTPKEVHELGLQEVKRVRDEMNRTAKQAGYEGRLDDYLEYLRTSKDFESPSGDTLCTQFRDIAGRIAPAMLKLFHLHTLPRMPFSIVETPSAHASMAPAAYYLAGSANTTAPRPGMFYVNTSELSTRRTYECEALALHEAIPGHHTQAAIQSENPDLPDFRRYAEDRRYFEAPCKYHEMVERENLRAL